MNVAIVGAGFTGLSAAYKLLKNGVKVTVFEAGDKPGGLAAGFREKVWDWHLEKHYHHWFKSDYNVINLAKELNFKFIFTHPKTSVYIKGSTFQLDSAFSLLNFPYLNPIDRLRTGIVIAFLKINPFWKPLEKIYAKDFIKKTMGKNSWEILWEPLFSGKFGNDSVSIPASWFWARIKKRSVSLGYPEGGFDAFLVRICEEIIKMGGKIQYNCPVTEIVKKDKRFVLNSLKGGYSFDSVICTLPTTQFTKIYKKLPVSYLKTLKSLKYLSAQTLILEIKNKFLTDNTYWLNINDKKFPFLAVVEHTNFVNRTHYGGHRILYIGNYLPGNSPNNLLAKEDLLKYYFPYLRVINNNFSDSWIYKSFLFSDRYAQPIIPLNYSENIPKINTPVKGLYLSTMQQVYPWDRGTNYAVELGEKTADLVLKYK